jgi:hypothetical protein
MDVREERRRLTASWLNIVAAGVISAGAVAPMIAAAANGTSEQTLRYLALGLASLICGLGLHAGARALISARTEHERKREIEEGAELAGTKRCSPESSRVVSGQGCVDGRQDF